MKKIVYNKLAINKEKVSELSQSTLKSIKGGAVTRRRDCDTVTRMTCAPSMTTPGC